MVWVLHNGAWNWTILESSDEVDSLTLRDFSDTGSALSFLQDLRDDPFSMAVLRGLGEERYRASDISNLNDHRLFELVAWELEEGCLRIAGEFRLLTLAGRAQAPVESEAGGEPFTPTPTVEPETTWIEIEMVGEDGQPVPFERYAITLPDGRNVARGMLDEKGFAHVAGSKKGTWIVSFPDLDKEAWEKI